MGKENCFISQAGLNTIEAENNVIFSHDICFNLPFFISIFLDDISDIAWALSLLSLLRDKNIPVPSNPYNGLIFVFVKSI